MPLREDEIEEVTAIVKAEIALAMKTKKKKVAAPVAKAAPVVKASPVASKSTYKKEVKTDV
jgi:hypothetical protein